MTGGSSGSTNRTKSCQAKEAAANLQAEGATLAQAAETLNLAYSGLYYVVGGHIYRENDLDCYPATRII